MLQREENSTVKQRRLSLTLSDLLSHRRTDALKPLRFIKPTVAARGPFNLEFILKV